MFDAALFAKQLTRREPGLELQRALESLWSVNLDVIQLRTPIGGTTIMQYVEPGYMEEDYVEEIEVHNVSALLGLPKDIVEVKAAFVENQPLMQSREVLLDAEVPDWRHHSGRPHTFIWRGERRELRLFPTPDDIYELWLIVNRTRPVNIPKWFHLLAGIRATQTLVESDQVKGRLGMVEYMKNLEELFYGSFQR